MSSWFVMCQRLLLGALLVSPVGASGLLVDPTRPHTKVVSTDTVEPEKAAEWVPQLQAIFSRNGQYSALINGERVFAGDYVADYRVLKVYRKSVVLSRDDETQELTLAGVVGISRTGVRPDGPGGE